MGWFRWIFGWFCWVLGKVGLRGSNDNDYNSCRMCGSVCFDALVQSDSYLLRCQSCLHIHAATSWIAIGCEWNRFVRVCLDGKTTGAPVLEGIGKDLAERIGKTAEDGTTLILIGEADPNYEQAHSPL